MSKDRFLTVTGEIGREDLGHCQPHEHVYIVNTIDQLICDLICMNNLPKSAEEMKLYRKAGGRTVVDANPLATGRDALALQDISKLSDVNIIATTGYHIPKFYPENHWIRETSEEELAELFASEVTEGMFMGGSYYRPTVRTDVKAGLIKAMILADGLENKETVRCLRAAGRAAKQSGASIMVHTDGADELRMIDLLCGKIGLAPSKVLVCHVDRQVKDLKRHEEIASTGVFMEYDTITLFQFHNNEEELRMLRHMIDKDFLNQILLSTDPETDRMKSYGSMVGIDYILTHFIPLMKLYGFTAEEIMRITHENPADALRIG
ncbi:MAG: phosphotriesterase [Lachnospiraceae bacterium]|nr:phosphotriesterase [Lachnospiraceae bacterium]